jgi:hypothetical protein
VKKNHEEGKDTKEELNAERQRCRDAEGLG